VITAPWRGSSSAKYPQNRILDQERFYEGEQGYTFHERGENDSGRLNATSHFRLPSHRLDGSPTDQTYAQASTDNCQTGTDPSAHET
jgi:hypothetical protein